MNDYRFERGSALFSEINKKKSDFISNYGITAFDHYALLSNEKEYKKKFLKEVFGNRCVYCGIKLPLIPLEMFEIDHFIPKVLNTSNKNNITNLVPSCRVCNRSKSDFSFSNPNKFNVETGLNILFYRDSQFYIRINNDYSTDAEVISFYNQMKFFREFRRLDYLLISLHKLIEKTDGIIKIYLKAAEDSLMLIKNGNSFF